MRAIAASLGALLCCCVLTTCGGTIRAINDDYASDAPIVRAIIPTSGVSGEQVTFQVAYCPGVTTDHDPQWIWDFGGGCDPNSSFDAEPTVNLRDGARSPYECKLTVRAGCKGKDTTETYSFTLYVAPLTVLSVSPTSGVAGGSATFSALVNGYVTSYSWDFGGVCVQSGSSLASPSVDFVSDLAPGDYPASLTVNNAYEITKYDFLISIIDNSAHSQGSGASL